MKAWQSVWVSHTGILPLGNLAGFLVLREFFVMELARV